MEEGGPRRLRASLTLDHVGDHSQHDCGYVRRRMSACGQQARPRVSAPSTLVGWWCKLWHSRAKSSSQQRARSPLGPARMSAVAQVREDVRAVVALRTMKHEPTRMKENLHLQEHVVRDLAGAEKSARAGCEPAPREERVVRPAAGTGDGDKAALLAVRRGQDALPHQQPTRRARRAGHNPPPPARQADSSPDQQYAHTRATYTGAEARPQRRTGVPHVCGGKTKVRHSVATGRSAAPAAASPRVD
jgi:hypothetical protein